MSRIKSRSANGSTGMEFLRFGSSIPGSYWGCCAADIIQNFKVDPDTKASIEIVGGDGGQAVGGKFAGPTYKDIFLQRLRFGTFETRDMPNHGFFVILSRSQLSSSVGKKWLGILKEQGFEFIRTINNSVWNVDNYVFALFRNCGTASVKDQFTPPKEWTDLPEVRVEAWQLIQDRPGLTAKQREFDVASYKKLPNQSTLLTEAQVVKAGAPVMLAGKRSEFPQEAKTTRDTYIQQQDAADKVRVDGIIAALGVKPTEAQKTAAYKAAGLFAEAISLKAAPTPTAV